MLVPCRTFLFLAALIVFPSFALAGGKAVAPVVPGFARFYADEKADAAKGGHLLFNELHCARCHAPRSGPESAKDVQPAPILDGVGARVKRSYLKQFLGDPQSAKPGTKMPNLFAGMEADEKKARVEAIVHFLASSGSPAQARPDRKAINVGQDLYSKVGCIACHGTRDAKGEEDKTFATSVPLGDLKAKYNLASLKAFLENPLQTRPHGRMPGILTAKEASDVANYLVQGATPGVSANNMKYSYYEGAWKNLPDFTKIKAVKTGEAADFDLSVARRSTDCALKFEGLLKIETAGNFTFHLTSDDGSKLWIDEKQVVNNDGVHAPTLKSGKTKLAKGVHKVVVGVFNAAAGFELNVEFEGPGVGKQPLGPRIVLTDEPVKPGPALVGDAENFPLEPALVAKGKELFASMGCANCHQMGNEKKRVTATAQANLKADGGCLATTPKKGIPWFGLSSVQKSALSAALNKPWPAQNDPREVIKTAMTAYNCYACHERDKIGGVSEELKNYFTSTFKEWGEETSMPPSLGGVGAKLNPAYFKKILEQGAHDRPYMNTRMPKFGPSAVHLAAVFANIDPAEKAPQVEFTQPLTKVKSAGRQLVGLPKGKTEAASCINCHNFGGVKTEGLVQGIDMAIMAERLNRAWFHNYLLDPAKYRRGTRMPTSFPDGTTPYKALGGNADAQIEAIWLYLADGKAATPPPGMNKIGIPLVPVGEAIIYRNFIKGAGSRAIGVGFPEHASLAFDANEIRLAMIWQGAFMDARRHWTDRGVGFEPPLGDNVLSLPTGAPFAVIAKINDEPWPTKSAKELGYLFKGYRLTDDQRPTFLYAFNDIKIEDTPNAIETKANPAIRRTLSISVENPIGKLYYRAAVADKIEADKDGWYRVNEWKTRIESAVPPVIRASGKKMELLVSVQFKEKSATIVQEYAW